MITKEDIKNIIKEFNFLDFNLEESENDIIESIITFKFTKKSYVAELVTSSVTTYFKFIDLNKEYNLGALKMLYLEKNSTFEIDKNNFIQKVLEIIKTELKIEYRKKKIENILKD